MFVNRTLTIDIKYAWFVDAIVTPKYINGNVLSMDTPILYVSKINDSCHEINKTRYLILMIRKYRYFVNKLWGDNQW